MSILRLDRLLEFLAGIQLAMAILWLGLAIFTVGLTILLYTRWGQYKPLRKCMAMSLLAHLLLAGYAATIEIIAPAPRPTEQILYVSLGDGPDENAPPGGAGPLLSQEKDQPWEVFPNDAVAQPKEAELDRGKTDQPAEPKRLVHVKEEKLPDDPAADHVALAQPARATSDDVPAALLRQIALSRMTETDAPEPLVATAGPTNPMRPKPVESVAGKVGGDAAYDDGDDVVAIGPGVEPGRFATPSIAGRTENRVPDAYRLRVAPNRAGIAQSRGGTAATEAAVKTALRWLADNQAADGRWDPRVHDAGRDANVLGRNRQNAGSRADTAMTGLALLSFLGSGHTHLDGPYQEDVRRGLEYLMRTQAPNGNLGGQAAAFEFMYCHAMAACALSEAYGMTRDRRLREPVRRAVGYTVAAQDPKGGGWRYRPGDAGDTSQLGWQLMSLKSADLAGIAMPEQTRQGIIRYLQSVSSGRYGGRASYRPGEQSTRPMTAEALVCWQFLGLPREHPACNEVGEYLVGELPGEGVCNLYYWYYATLGMYQLQGNHWQRWNEALRAALVSRQVKEGPLAGSWDTDDLWGGHGGRVYTTTLATLTLEVYYRFLPIYGGVNSDEDRAK